MSPDSGKGHDVLTPTTIRPANELVRVNLLVPAPLRKKWKTVALAADKTLTELIIEAMQHQINQTKKTEGSTI